MDERINEKLFLISLFNTNNDKKASIELAFLLPLSGVMLTLVV